jgi:hypothetical protein
VLLSDASIKKLTTIVIVVTCVRILPFVFAPHNCGANRPPVSKSKNLVFIMFMREASSAVIPSDRQIFATKCQIEFRKANGDTRLAWEAGDSPTG